MEYFEIRIHPVDEEKRGILTSLLAEEYFESFAETEDELLAYVPVNLYKRQVVAAICSRFEADFSEKKIPDQNWNAEWEKNFEPVLIAGKCFIRAPFHATRPEYPYEIIIEPKMSFGTAHHETTAMMIQAMLELDFREKKVLDMGCGTGILAILAGMLGAAEVDAIDNDDWAYRNAVENISRNHAQGINVKQGDVDTADSGYDILLANINRNVLLVHLPEYSKRMLKGELLLSGFYMDDLEVIRQAAAANGFIFERHITNNNWVAALFKK